MYIPEKTTILLCQKVKYGNPGRMPHCFGKTGKLLLCYGIFFIFHSYSYLLFAKLRMIF